MKPGFENQVEVFRQDTVMKPGIENQVQVL